MMRQRASVARLLTYAVLVAGSAFMLLPLYWMLNSSLKTNARVFDFPPQWLPSPAEWSNYPALFSYMPFLTFIKNTLIIEIGVIAGTLASCSLAAYSFARLNWPGRDIVFVILLSVLMLPTFSTLVPSFILWQHLHAVDTFAPLIVPAWFGNSFFIFLLRQFFRGIPRDLEEAARIDGAGIVRVFTSIILPLSKPALAVVAIFAFMGVWNDFLGPLIYLSSTSNLTLAVGLNLFLTSNGTRWELLMAASCIVVVPMVVIFFAFQRYFIEGIALTGIKG
jgi:multiple sugar transport system permease protein